MVTCALCARFSGCGHLKGGPSLDRDKLITFENPRVCTDAVEIQEPERLFRETLLETLMDGGLDALYRMRDRQALTHQMVQIDMEDKTLDVPDFLGMILGEDGVAFGVTLDDREKQLRYEINDDGTVRTVGDVPVVISQLALRSYVLSEQFAEFANNPPRHENVWCWSTDELIDLVLREELDAGLIVRHSNDKKEGSTIMPRPKSSAAAGAKKTGTSGRPKPISIPNSGGGTKSPPAAKKAAAKKKAGTSKAPAKASSTATETEEPVASVDLGPVLERMELLEQQQNAIIEMLEQVATSVVQTTTLVHNAVMKQVNENHSDMVTGLNTALEHLLNLCGADNTDEVMDQVYTEFTANSPTTEEDDGEGGTITTVVPDARELNLNEGESIMDYLGNEGGEEE